MKKRFLAFLLVFATLFALAACSGGESSVTTTYSGSDTDGFYTDYLPSDSDEENSASSSSQVTSPVTTQTSTTPVTETPPVTDIPIVSSTNATTTSTSTTSTFKKTWSYIEQTDNTNNQGSAFVPETWEPLNVVPNQVLALDQLGKRVVLYDISKATNGNLDQAEIWSYNCGSAAGVKYRTGTKFGNVVLVASGSKHQIITYPGKQVKWSVNAHSGSNPHSIEILPSGNVVIASSSDNKILLYDTSKSNSYKTYTLLDAHGVLWDPAYNVLWALGQEELVSYTVTGSGSNQALTVKQRYKLPSTFGHDLSADFFSKDHLYLTAGDVVFRFHKGEGTFLRGFNGSSAVVTQPREDGTATYGVNVKGFGVNENSNFFYCFPNYWKGTNLPEGDMGLWTTTKIHFIRQTGIRSFKTEVYSSSKCAYYKVRVFCGKYQ